MGGKAGVSNSVEGGLQGSAYYGRGCEYGDGIAFYPRGQGVGKVKFLDPHLGGASSLEPPA